MSAAEAVRHYPELATVPVFADVVRIVARSDRGQRNPLKGCNQWVTKSGVVNWAPIRSVLRRYPDWDGRPNWKYRLLRMIVANRARDAGPEGDVPAPAASDTDGRHNTPTVRPKRKAAKQSQTLARQRSIQGYLRRSGRAGASDSARSSPAAAAVPPALSPTGIPEEYGGDHAPSPGADPYAAALPWIPEASRRECLFRVCEQNETIAGLRCEARRSEVELERLRRETERQRTDSERLRRDVAYANIFHAVEPSDRPAFLAGFRAMLRGGIIHAATTTTTEAATAGD